jgi:hypothetical protein
MSRNNLIRWAFKGFIGTLILINLILTAVFGFSYLGPAFGDSFVADYAGAAYAVLLFDLAFLAWFYTYLWIAESGEQRSIAIGLSVASLLGSTMATLQQLGINAVGLVDLSAHHETVGMIALLVTLTMTALHIIGGMAYTYFAPAENKRQHDIDERTEIASAQQGVNDQLRAAKIKLVKAQGKIQADAMEDAVPELERRMRERMSGIVDRLTADHERNLLAMLGFTPDGKQVGRGGSLPVTIDQQPDLPTPAVASADDDKPTGQPKREPNSERPFGFPGGQPPENSADLSAMAENQAGRARPANGTGPMRAGDTVMGQVPADAVRTLMFDKNQNLFFETWVDEHGEAWSKVLSLSSDPRRAWQQIQQSQITIPRRMDYTKFAALHRQGNGRNFS